MKLIVGILLFVSENKNIRTFTVADIEKYWKKLLSAAEMHAMEKAAMDDPFLADAMEGYKNTATASGDVQQLNQKLEETISDKTKVVFIGSSRIKWLRVAAAVIIIGGIGVLTQQLFFNPEKNELAVVKDDKSAVPKSTQQSSLSTNDSVGTLSVPAKTKNENAATKEKAASPGVINRPVTVEKVTEKETITSNENITKAKEAKEKTIAADETTPISSAVAENITAPVAKSKADTNKLNEGLALREVAVAQKRQNASAEYKYSQAINLNHSYNYRIVDTQNNPVPFANVSNVKDGIGTYTDMKGYFNLVSSDSVMEVQVKSLGYTNSTFKLRPATTTPELVMQEDEKLRSSILANNRKVVSSVTRKDTAELEEPEVGWGYYNTYAANNLKIPDNFRDKKPVSNVELSFDVDKNGQPVNIKVIKSSECKACDEEAIRLLKEGPKWKRKGKKAKTSVVVSVDQ